jgi:hypothetical protein
VKNVWLSIAQMGSRKIAQINFTQRVGTVSGSDVARTLLDVERATLRTIFPARLDLRAPRCFVDLRFVDLKLVRRLRASSRILKSEIWNLWGAQGC